MPSRRILHKSLLRCSHCRRHFQESASALIYVARRCRDRVLAVCGARIGLARGTQAVSGLMGRITGRRGGPRIRFDEILASATARTYGSLRPDRNGWSRRRASAARCCSTYSGRAAGCWPHDGVVTGGRRRWSHFSDFRFGAVAATLSGWRRPDRDSWPRGHSSARIFTFIIITEDSRPACGPPFVEAVNVGVLEDIADPHIDPFARRRFTQAPRELGDEPLPLLHFGQVGHWISPVIYRADAQPRPAVRCSRHHSNRRRHWVLEISAWS